MHRSRPDSRFGAAGPAASRRGLSGFLIAALAIGAAVALLQLAGQAYSGGLDRNMSDEPSHYVTGLLGYDYVEHGLGSSPVAYAIDYYTHYPGVAIGHWPPVYYGLTAFFYLLVGPGVEKAIFLNALLTIAAGLVLFGFVRKRRGFWIALAAALVTVSLREVQAGANHAMPEPLTLLFTLSALAALAAFLETGSWKKLAGYCLLAALAIMTKALAWSLAPVAIVSAIWLRKWSLLRSWKFWALHVAAFLPCLIWERAVAHLVSSGLSDPVDTLPAALNRGMILAGQVATQIGWPAAALAAGTAAALCLFPPKAESKAWMLPQGVFFFGHLTMLLIAPTVPDARYTMIALPAAVLLAFHGVDEIQARLTRRFGGSPRLVEAGLVGALLLSIGLSFSLAPRRDAEFSTAAAEVLGDPKREGQAVMIASESGGELLFVGEAANLSPHPSRYVVRATKLLSRTSWMAGQDYFLKYKTAREVEQALLKIPVLTVVLHEDDPYETYEHFALLRQMVSSESGKWKHLRSYPVTGTYSGHGSLEVYEYTGTEAAEPGKFQLDMSFTLGRSLVVDPETGAVED